MKQNKLCSISTEKLVCELSKLPPDGMMITTRALIIWTLQDRLNLDKNVVKAQDQLMKLFPEMWL